MGMDLVFNKIIDGERIERIESFPINFLRDFYSELVRTISHYSTMHNNSITDVYICPSTNFMTIYRKFDEFCKQNVVDTEEKKVELIKAITDNDDEDKIRFLVDEYIEIRDFNEVKLYNIKRIQNIMEILKEYADKNAYLYLSY